jgi:hypothetical protein
MRDNPNACPAGKFGYPDGRPSDLVEQFDPNYAYRETGLWNGMTGEETTVWLEEMRKESAQRAILYCFPAAGPAN